MDTSKYEPKERKAAKRIQRHPEYKKLQLKNKQLREENEKRLTEGNYKKKEEDLRQQMRVLKADNDALREKLAEHNISI